MILIDGKESKLSFNPRKIRLRDIPDTGMEIRSEGSHIEAWVNELVMEVVDGIDIKKDSICLNLSIVKDETFIRVDGAISFHVQMECHFCLESYERPIDTNISLFIMPVSMAFDNKKDNAAERELEKDELDLLYYTREGFDLIALIREQCILDLPAKHICSEDCRGLCSECGSNRNKMACQCVPEGDVDIRFSALKGFKLKH